jgi:hypothetical protein
LQPTWGILVATAIAGLVQLEPIERGARQRSRKVRVAVPAKFLSHRSMSISASACPPEISTAEVSEKIDLNQ